ncbi:ABC transporter ATP-binding protein [Paenibacillus aurantius]|uniref:ABC transporter ATP-binding protein n=1 Tax=Paenibacillus aurantius TaxID=2918900 RepID=A0AA96L9T2_9BACL|nr:ABC transporter ATP-binding protein [Paenibacillus aurantius]WNQ09652.1 ABC transporter ATP-binding protein [Paenibacillus aurantius]
MSGIAYRVKWLWEFVAPFKGWYIFCVVLMFSQSIVTLGLTGIQKMMIDNVLLQRQYSELPKIITLFIASFLAFSALYVIVSRVMFKCRLDTAHRISKKLLNVILYMPQSLFQKERTATYIYYMTRDADGLAIVTAARVTRAFQHLFYIILIFLIMKQMGWIVVIASTILILIYFILGKVLAPLLKKSAQEVHEEKSKLTVIVEEGISSTREVLAYNRQSWEKKRFDQQFYHYYDKVINEGKRTNLQIVLSEPVKWGIHLLILGIGGYAVIQKTISLGTFIISYQFIAQLINSFQNLFNFSLDFSKAISSVDRLDAVMKNQSNDNAYEKLEGKIQNIRFNDIYFSYTADQLSVLKGLNFSIPVGKKVAFVGESGSGKSTIAQLLIRSYSANNGQIYINSHRLADIKMGDWMSRISIVFQEPYFFADTIRTNLEFGLEVAEEKLQMACRYAQIEETILSLPEGFNTVIGDRGITLSGGQRQRLAIARAILRDSEILILDEATSALDLETERRVQQALDEVRAGRTTILIAHRLSTIRNADVIYVIDKGQLVGQGSYDQLIATSAHFKRLVQQQEVVDNYSEVEQKLPI